MKWCVWSWELVQRLRGNEDEDDERDEELEQETTSKALSKRQKMEAEEVDEFRYEDYSTIFIDPKQFENWET